MKVIYQHKNMRVIEVPDSDFDMPDLKGDCFNPDANKGMDIKQLAYEERVFETKIANQGVWGYILEVWNPEVDTGWTMIESCFGFVGQDKNEQHYIVAEFIERIKEETGE